MTSSSVYVQSTLSIPTTRVGRTSGRNVFTPTLHFPCQQKNNSLRVQCMSEDQKPETSTPIEMPTTAPQTPPPAPKASRRLSDLMAFSGAAPERINGRLAMIGFVSAIAAELTIGDDVVAQLANGGFGLFVGTTVLLSMASLVPLIKGVSVESKSNGVMTSDAEMWNGRFAMLGLVALVFTEFVKGGALV